MVAMIATTEAILDPALKLYVFMPFLLTFRQIWKRYCTVRTVNKWLTGLRLFTFFHKKCSLL